MHRISQALHARNTPTASDKLLAHPREVSLRPGAVGNNKSVTQVGCEQIQAAVKEVCRDGYIAPKPSGDFPAWFIANLQQMEEIHLRAEGLSKFISESKEISLDFETLHAEAIRLERGLREIGKDFKRHLRPYLYYLGTKEPETPAWVMDERPVDSLMKSSLAVGRLLRKTSPFVRPPMSMWSRIRGWMKRG